MSDMTATDARDRTSLARVIDIARRNWWLPVLAAVVAAAIGAAVAARAEVVYTGAASLTVTGGTLNLAPQLPGPDTMVAAVTTADFAEKVADAAGLDAGQVHLSAFVTGNPSSVLTVRATAPSADLAEQVAKAAGEQALAKARELSEPELAQYRTGVESADAALAELGTERTPTTAADVTYYRYSIENARTYNAKVLSYLENLYRLSPDTSVSASSPRTAAIKNGAAAGLLGFVLGLAVVAVREMMGRRRVTSAE